MNFVVMYHKFCRDGFCSAAIAHFYFTQLNKQRKEPEKIHVDYFPVVAGHVDDAVDLLYDKFGHNPESVKVLSFDLSFTYTAASKLFRYFPTAQVLDHHKTTKDECFSGPPVEVSEADYNANLEVFKQQLHFDNDSSGASLAFRFFFNDTELPLFVKYVEDSDIWAWKLPNSKAISAGLYRHLNMPYVSPDEFKEVSPFSFEDTNVTFSILGGNGNIPVFDQWIIFMSNEEWVEPVKSDGSIVIDIQNKTMTRQCTTGKAYTVDEQRIFVVNANSFISELGNKICEWTEDDKSRSYDYAVVWRYDANADICYVSLRSLQGSGVDVSLVAKNLGGGGHENAAGFEIGLDEFRESLKLGTWKK